MRQVKLDDYLYNYQVFFKKNKHMYLRVKENIITVTCNKKMTYDMIESFIIHHKRWILSRNKIDDKIDLYSSNKMNLWGISYPIVYDAMMKESIVFDGNQFYFKSKDISKNKIELFYKEEIIKEINRVISIEKDLINQYIDIKNLTYKTQLMKSRLGSCLSQKRIVKLNSILARFEKKYLKLVLFHELAHLNVQNHSYKFHQLLEKLYKNHVTENRALKSQVKKFKM